MHRDGPTLSSELLAAHRAVWPQLIREQRPWAGSLICLVAALVAGTAIGRYIPRGGWVLPLLAGCLAGVWCGGVFRLTARPVENRWRWVAVACALLAVITVHLFWQEWATQPDRGRYTTAATLTAAGLCAWYFSIRVPTQEEIIRRARRMSMS